MLLFNKNLKLNYHTKNKYFNLIFILILIFFLAQIYGLIVTENSIYNSYYIIVSLVAIFFAFISYSKNLEELSFYICIFFLSVVVIIYSFLSYRWLFSTGNLLLYGTFPDAYIGLKSFSNNIIRSSGLSRSSLILIIPLLYLLLINRVKLIILIPYLLLSSNIYLTQSRTTMIFYYPLVVFFVFYLLRNENYKYKIQKFFILFLLPILFFNTILVVKEELRSKHYSKKIIKQLRLDSRLEVLDTESVKKDFEDLKCHTILYPDIKWSGVIASDPEKYNKLKKKCNSLLQQLTFEFYGGHKARKIDSKTLTSHRVKYWKEVIYFSNNPIMGYGVLGDRFLINQNSHNIIIYSYASGGIISALIILILILRYSYLCIDLIFFKKIPLKEENLFIYSSIFIISYLLYRGIAENSFGVFSIDLLCFLTCIVICEKFVNENQKKL